MMPPATANIATAALLPTEERREFAEEMLGKRALEDDLLRGWQAKAVLAAARQAEIKQAFDTARLHDHPALGRCFAVIDPLVYEKARQLHGETCWRDPEFRKAFLRDNPECRVESTPARTTIIRP